MYSMKRISELSIRQQKYIAGLCLGVCSLFLAKIYPAVETVAYASALAGAYVILATLIDDIHTWYYSKKKPENNSVNKD